MVDTLLIGLNEKQQQAITATEGYIRVIAGAGSGKTKTLVNRYAYLVEGLGISPKNILCVTFTNRAAGEMRKRVKNLLGNENDGSLICTYHGFCVKVLREDIHHINYPKNFMIIDEDDQKDILKEVYDELGLTIKFMKFEEVLKAIGFYKLNTSYVELLTNPSKTVEIDTEQPILGQVIAHYLKKQRKYFALDFNDLINFVFYLYEQNEEVKKKWQERLHYVQVDEFQDSSARQIALINLLSERHKNLFVVGDPDQAIYGWRGARPDALVNFDQTHQPCQTIILNENYRSTPEVLNVGNSIIKSNKMRVEKDLFTQNNSGPAAIHFHGKNEFEEVKFIAETITKMVKNNAANYKDFAILYRANYNSRFIEQGFMKANIPYTMFSGFKFFQRAEIKDCIAYLKMIVHGDDLSFIRTVNNPKRGFGKTKLNFLKDRAEAAGTSLYNVLLKYQGNAKLKGTSIKKYIDTIEKYKETYKSLSVSDLLREILDDAGYDEQLRLNGDQERIDNVSELLASIIATEENYGEKLELDDYLQQIALFSDTDREDSKDAVKLMTIHTAKGLEFPYVFLVSFSDGTLPSYRSLDDNGIEEERRLAHVAVTRAMKQFFMTESEGMTNYGRSKIPSRFIFEVQDNLYERVGEIDQELIDQAIIMIKISQRKKQIELNTEVTFEVGDTVNHPIFKNGVIKEVNIDNHQYLVHFTEMDITKPISFNFKGLAKL